MTVSPRVRCDERGLLMIWNQTPQPIATTLTVPLYYTGLSTTTMVSVEGGALIEHTLARDYSISVNVTMPAMTVTWMVFTAK